ncbi:putative TonB-dependent receptor [Nitrospira japonica]|uniref:Putative TonB-dependent receptor n=1 Tax=Nitrospira japonica TaxID=1325564 RepID=A0A1W1I8J7_9BACT|nr:TonB-dependent receptor [Nitrospira japonica]SLM49315.1 putative TonB-dependent receptor [Nitrospira japonica]
MKSHVYFVSLALLTSVIFLSASIVRVQAQEESGSVPAQESDVMNIDPVVVTATRTQRSLSDIPVSVSVVTQQDIKDAPALGTDDILRTVPGINMPFLNSFTQHPTGNLPGMRGLGELRALVLVDGIPLNDPFFGYTQWNMVPKETIEQVEVVRGGASSLWGNFAMGGVINIITRNAQPRTVSQSLLGGSNASIRSNTYVSDRINDRFGISANVNYNQTAGYTPQQADMRGAIDQNASSANANVQFKADYQSPDFKWYGRANYYNSSQNVGRALADNQQNTVNFQTGGTWKLSEPETFEANVFYLQQQFTTNNPSLVTPGDRNSDFLSNLHQIPVTSIGGYTQYSRELNETFRSFQLGLDFRQIQSVDRAQLYSAPGASPTTLNGYGNQMFVGAFGQASVFPIPKLELLGSLRMDFYSNYASKQEASPGGTTNFPNESKVQLNPKLAARYEINEPLAIRAAVYRAFRAPTLDALHYNFIATGFSLLSNPQLGPETMWGGDTGLDVHVGRFKGQVNVFWNEVSNAITPITISFFPVFTQQWFNVGALRSRGLELMGEVDLAQYWSVIFGYTYTDSTITSNPLDPSVVGNRNPNIPLNFETATLRYRKPQGLDFAFRMRALQDIYATTDNTVKLSNQFILDVSGSYPIYKNISAFVIGENILNDQYLVSIVGANWMGAPRQFFGGINFTL